MASASLGGDSIGKRIRENVTPHKIAMLHLIREYRISRSVKNPLDASLNDSIEDICLSERDKRVFMTTLLNILQSGDIELAKLVDIIKRVTSSKPLLYELFMKSLQDLYDKGVQGLMDFFQLLPEQLFQENDLRVNKASVVGLFIRRMLLAFDVLSFGQVVSLFNNFKAYFNAFKSLQESDGDVSSLEDSIMVLITGDGNRGVGDGAIGKSKDNFEELGLHSQRQAEFFITQQTHLLHHNESEALNPKSLQEKIRELLRANPELTEAHYLSYLNNLRVDEFCNSLKSLYHYFDRLAVDNQKDSAKAKDEESSKAYRYAVLNLAALHYRFGNREEALAALQETISIAQEYNDNVCLQHALGWLHRLGEQNSMNTASLLERSVTKSNELHLPYLTSLGIQAFAKHSAANCVQPSSVFEFLMKSDILNCQHSQLDLMAISHAQKSAMWYLYGNRLMSSAYAQLLLHLNTVESSIYMNGEAGCIALCNLAQQQASEGYFKTAYEILENCKVRFPPKSKFSTPWMITENVILFDRAMYQGCLSDAEKAVDRISAIYPMEAKFRKAIVLKARGDNNEALDLLMECMEGQCPDMSEMTPDFHARVTLVYSELYCQTGNTVSAISPLLSCLTYCKRHYFKYLMTIATMYLAYVQYCLNLPLRAIELLESSLISMLTHGTVYDKGRVFFLYARCLIAASKQKPDEDRTKALKKALSLLQRSVDHFKKIEAYSRLKDVFYIQARIYDVLGMTAERNKSSLEFRQLDQLHPSSLHTTINIL